MQTRTAPATLPRQLHIQMASGIHPHVITLPRRILIHLERFNEPVRLPERRGVIRDEILARGRHGRTATRAPDTACPAAAERRIEDLICFPSVSPRQNPRGTNGAGTERTYNLHLAKVGIKAAASRGKLGERRAPIRRVGCAGSDIRGGGSAREEPDADTCRGPLCCVDAAAGVVEPRPVGPA